MSKRKMIALILLAVFLLFSVSTYLNYESSRENEADYMIDRMELDYRNFKTNLANIEQQNPELKNTNAVINKDCTYLQLTMLKCQYNSGYNDFPYVAGLIDKDGKIVARTKSALYVEEYTSKREFVTSYYADLEKYMTDEVKTEISEYISSLSSTPVLKYLGMRRSGSNKIEPTEVCIYNGINEDEGKVIFFNNGYASNYLNFNGDTVNVCFYGINHLSYEEDYYSELNTQMEEFAKLEHGFNGGGGFSAADEINYNSVITIDGEDYIFYYAAKYNLGMRALVSDFFRYLTQQLAIMYLIVAAVIIFVALKLYDKSERLNESRKAFISAAAHELKTPIAVIQNQSECVLESIAPEKNGEYVKSIHDEALRMNGIVSSLLTFNRLTNVNEVQKGKCNLSEIVKEEKEKYLSFAESKGVTVTDEITDNIFVMCNKDLMAMAVDNYLSNAIKYAAAEKQVKIKLTQNGGKFSLEVFNTGEKIDDDTAKEMWEIFSRKDKARNSASNSSGMGLPICKRIFDLHRFEGKYSYNDGVVFEVKGSI